MEDVMLSPLQELQQWVGNSSRSRSHESVWTLKSSRAPARKAGCAPFVVPSETMEAARTFRARHYKTAKQWAKTRIDNVAVWQITAAPVKAKNIEAEFSELAGAWDRETAHLSSPLQKMMHPSYHAILGISAESPGNKRQIIRLLLQDLKTNRRDWFLMLSYLTQQNPIDPRDSGKTSKMIASWLTWGEKQGLL